VLFKNFLLAMSSTGFLFATIALISDQPAMAKGSKSSHVARGAYLVPPPPPYQPSVLPEYSLTGTTSSAQTIASAEVKPEQRYSKYIYVRNSADAPRVVHSKSGVTSWSKSE
jgi:hypothetical protein